MHGFLFGSTYTTCSAAFVFFVGLSNATSGVHIRQPQEVVPCKVKTPGLSTFLYDILWDTAGLSKSLPYIVTFHLIYRNHIHSYQVYHVSSVIDWFVSSHFLGQKPNGHSNPPEAQRTRRCSRGKEAERRVGNASNPGLSCRTTRCQEKKRYKPGNSNICSKKTGNDWSFLSRVALKHCFVCMQHPESFKWRYLCLSCEYRWIPCLGKKKTRMQLLLTETQ